MIWILRSSFILLTLVIFPGCTRIIVKPVKLPTVEQPTLEPIKSSELWCLSNSTYIKIVNRENKLRQWGLEQFNILKVNNQKAN